MARRIVRFYSIALLSSLHITTAKQFFNQVRFNNMSVVTEVHTQGDGNDEQRVNMFRMEYSVGSEFRTVNDVNGASVVI